MLTEGSVTKEISYTVARNPNWSPEIHCEIQTSTVKCGNPLWNPEIHSEIQKSTLKSGNPIQDSTKIVHKYPYTFINCTTQACTWTVLWRNRMSPYEWPLSPADLQSGTKVILLRWCNCNCQMYYVWSTNMPACVWHQQTHSMHMYMYDNQWTCCLWLCGEVPVTVSILAERNGVNESWVYF